MSDPVKSPTPGETSGGWLVFGCALTFWLLVPFPVWLIGMGFAGQLVLLPDDWEPLSILWVIAFYAPLALMAFVVIDGIWSQTRRNADD